jgi:hypothetical protein
MSTEQYDVVIAAAAVHVCDVARLCCLSVCVYVCAPILILVCFFYSLSPLGSKKLMVGSLRKFLNYCFTKFLTIPLIFVLFYWS